jgi:hypothetical protein
MPAASRAIPNVLFIILELLMAGQIPQPKPACHWPCLIHAIGKSGQKPGFKAFGVAFCGRPGAGLCVLQEADSDWELI